MDNKSAKKEKNIYYTCRDELGLTRDQASERLEWISADRLEKIENERVSAPNPEEVLAMADAYGRPDPAITTALISAESAKKYVPEVQIKDLPHIVLEMLASLNAMDKQKNRLIEITADGEISDDELADFAAIQRDLEHISMTVESLQLWSEQMIASGKISQSQLDKLQKK